MRFDRFQRPSRYINHEFGAVHRDATVRVALAFPDVYDVGMSHLGLKILYHIINQLPDAVAERAFHPWIDMEAELRKRGEPLRSLESGRPLCEFDMVGMSLQYELSYTSVLGMLDLGGIPLRSEARDGRHPIVMAGGPCTVNPEPMVPFIDAFLIGDGEDAILEIVDILKAWKTNVAGDRGALLRALAQIPGVYVPQVHDAMGACVRRRYVQSLEDAPYPASQVVPYTAIVHDRVNIEVSRGCTMGCRFCQAGMIYRPLRERSPEKVLALAEQALRNTGYEEISFTSLSAGDYSGLLPLLRGINRRFGQSKIAISLPSLRVKAVRDEVLKEIKAVKKTGFTIAPEAATARLRAVINKDFNEEDYARALESLFRAGWLNLKLYFMIGLPTETDADIEGITTMARQALTAAKRHTGRFVNLSLSVSPFVPKAHTPFQWFGMAGIERIKEIKHQVERSLKKMNIRGHDENTSLLEAAFARGDRRLAELVETAYRGGARLDGWGETFDRRIWQRAMEQTGIDAAAYAARTFSDGEALPWDRIDVGVSKRYLLSEKNKAMDAGNTPNCTEKCTGCGLKCRTDGEARPASGYAEDKGYSPRSPISDIPVRKPIRIRARFSKTGALKFLSHRELMTHMTRALRRAGVRLEHTQGFSPSPKVAFGPPLGVGVAGTGEYFDMELIPLMPLEEVARRLNHQLGDGVSVHEMASIGMQEPSLQGFVTRYEYEIVSPSAIMLQEFMDRAEVIVARDKGPVDIRPMLIEAIPLSGSSARVIVQDMGERKVRIDEIARMVFGHPSEELDIVRTALWGQKAGAWVMPMETRTKWSAVSL